MTQYVIRWTKMPAYYSYEGKEEGKVEEREKKKGGKEYIEKGERRFT